MVSVHSDLDLSFLVSRKLSPRLYQRNYFSGKQRDFPENKLLQIIKKKREKTLGILEENLVIFEGQRPKSKFIFNIQKLQFTRLRP